MARFLRFLPLRPDGHPSKKMLEAWVRSTTSGGQTEFGAGADHEGRGAFGDPHLPLAERHRELWRACVIHRLPRRPVARRLFPLQPLGDHRAGVEHRSALARVRTP